MKIADMTLAYTESSGGIRTYLDQKRRFLNAQTEHEHVLVIAGEDDAHETEGRLSKRVVASPTIPGCEPYRFFWRPGKLVSFLDEEAPDVIELGSFFVCPWTAFRHRKKRQEQGQDCRVVAYFHTDIANAYFSEPVQGALHGELTQHSEFIRAVADRIHEAVSDGAEAYFGKIFEQCDAVLAASQEQANRLADYGIETPQIVPLGVDCERFHPERRRDDWRRQFGPDDAVILIYAGRLDEEKQVNVLVDAFAQLGSEFRLVMLGEGPLREDLEARAGELDGLHVLGYENDKDAYAALLASADIYVTAGPHETFGLSIIEAQACGLPVVGVDAGALRERVTPEIGRLGPPADATAMAAHIREVATQAETMGRRARQHVLDGGFNWDATFQKLLSVYQQSE